MNKFPLVIEASSHRDSLLSLDPGPIIDEYKNHGALLFKKFLWDTAEFAEFTKMFCTHSAYNESPGRLMIEPVNSIQTVNLGSEKFPFHPELSRTPWRPDVCFFACKTPAQKGGETFISDGCRIVEAMPVHLSTELSTRKLRFRQSVKLKEARFWLSHPNPGPQELASPPEQCPYTFELIDGRPEKIFDRPFLNRAMFSDELAFANFTLFARLFHRNYTSPTFDDGGQIGDELVSQLDRLTNRFKEAVRWEHGDVLMLDNSRFMHAREELPDTRNRQILTYFGYLKFAIPPHYEGKNPRWRIPGEMSSLFH